MTMSVAEILEFIGDVRLLAAFGYYVTAIVLLRAASHVWSMPPQRRALVFGPFLQPRGVAVLLRYLPVVWIIGASILGCAVGRTANWIAYPAATHQAPEWVVALRTLECLLALSAGAASSFIAIRAWLIRR